MPTAWSDERRRRYERTRVSVLERGVSEDAAIAIATALVNEERARERRRTARRKDER